MIRRPKAPAGCPTYPSRTAAYNAARRAGTGKGETRCWPCDGGVWIWAHVPTIPTPEYIEMLASQSFGAARYSRIFR